MITGVLLLTTAPDDMPVGPTVLLSPVRLWAYRGALVGAVLGGAVGTIIPFVGNLFGAVLGFIPGGTIGTLVAVFSAVTRQWFPADPQTTHRREKVFCVIVIWVLAIASTWTWADGILIVPAGLGTIHAVLSAAPEPGAVYCGRPSPMAEKICRGLPVAIGILMLLVWAAALVVHVVLSP